MRMHKVILKALQLDLPHQFSDKYEIADPDWRAHDFSSADITPYTQVFSDRYLFVPNLSILDALFNLGPETTRLLT